MSVLELSLKLARGLVCFVWYSVLLWVRMLLVRASRRSKADVLKAIHGFQSGAWSGSVSRDMTLVYNHYKFTMIVNSYRILPHFYGCFIGISSRAWRIQANAIESTRRPGSQNRLDRTRLEIIEPRCNKYNMPSYRVYADDHTHTGIRTATRANCPIDSCICEYILRLPRARRQWLPCRWWSGGFYADYSTSKRRTD